MELIEALSASGGHDVDVPSEVLDRASVSRLLGVAAQGVTLYQERMSGQLLDTDQLLDADQFSPTDAVNLATVALRAHDLTPFELALWFRRSST
ncbi:hypothetical protein [Streptomyces antimycoticus]|uniref:hypothetical protein n=2 Tax=Streptomyces TaxID=1883 RepID=UPI00117C821B|nr:hypothetical protein [Streptomyces antimycoticus]